MMAGEKPSQPEKFNIEAFKVKLIQLFVGYLENVQEKEKRSADKTTESEKLRLEAEAQKKYAELVIGVASALREAPTDSEKEAVVAAVSRVITQTPGAMESTGRIAGNARITFWEQVAIEASRTNANP
jgi:hypothetical protein